jgi:RNA polymerase sigma-70 factor (family 1)
MQTSDNLLTKSFYIPNSAAFNDLYRQFRQDFEKLYAPLCQYAFRLVKETEASEDIVQDVFARVWEKRKDLIGANNLRYYLFTAVRNNCLTHLEQGQRLSVYSLNYLDIPDNESEELASKAGDPDQEPLNYKALLEKGIELLPPKCKEIFLLNRMGQLSNREIALTLRISVKTVENQLWKAMKMLRTFAKNIHEF